MSPLAIYSEWTPRQVKNTVGIISRKNRREYIMTLARELNLVREDEFGTDYYGLAGYAFRTMGKGMMEFDDGEFRRLIRLLEQDVERRRKEKK